MKNSAGRKIAVILAAVSVQLCLGVLYAWPVFTKPLLDSGYSTLQTQAIFAAAFVFLPAMNIVAGRLSPLFGPQVLIRLSGAILGLAYFLAGFLGSKHFFSMLFLLGICGGMAIGLGYSIPIAVGMKWYPERKGLITGITVSGFGMGAIIWIKLADDWGNFIGNYGIDQTLMIFGVIFFLIMVLASFFMVLPPSKAVSIKESETTWALTSKEMLRTSQYYAILTAFILSTCAGLMVIGLMKIFPIEALERNNIAHASIVAGTAMAIFFAPANGFGRIAWGSLSDLIGRKNSLIIMTISQSALIISFPFLASDPWGLYASCVLIGFNFGGNFSLFPTITSETFGPRYFVQNNGWIIIGWGIGGVIGPLLGGLLGDLKQFHMAYTLAGLMCLLAALIIYLMKPIKKPH